MQMKPQHLFIITLALLGGLSCRSQTRTDRILRELHDPDSKYVLVIAHRGDWRNFPENSLPAYESAIKMGADVVEIDVQRTVDGHLVICHDATIDRTSSGKGKIEELTLDSLKRCCLRAGNNIRKRNMQMPTLEEVFDLCKDRCLINIDRGFAYYDQILAIAKERNMTEQILINAHASPEKQAKVYAPHKVNLPYVPILNVDAARWPRVKKYADEFLASKPPLTAYEVCWDGSVEDVGDLCRRIKESGSKIWINTMWFSMWGGPALGIDDDNAMEDPDAIYGKVLSYGAGIIMTERPKLLLDYLDSIGRHTLR